MAVKLDFHLGNRGVAVLIVGAFVGGAVITAMFGARQPPLRGEPGDYSHRRPFPAVSGPSASSFPAGWYGATNSPNQDRNAELQARCGHFNRVFTTGDTFGELCGQLGMICAGVCDWEGRPQPCTANAHDGSRVVLCQPLGESAVAPFSVPGRSRFYPWSPPAGFAAPGLYGSANSPNQDRNMELQTRCGPFARVFATGDTFDQLCEQLGLKCAYVCDWEGHMQPCGSDVHDGSRVVSCLAASAGFNIP